MVGFKCGLDKMPQDEIPEEKHYHSAVCLVITPIFIYFSFFVCLFVFNSTLTQIFELIQWTLKVICLLDFCNINNYSIILKCLN